MVLDVVGRFPECLEINLVAGKPRKNVSASTEWHASVFDECRGYASYSMKPLLDRLAFKMISFEALKTVPTFSVSVAQVM